MMSIPQYECPFIMTGTTARREVNAYKKTIMAYAIRLSNPDVDFTNLLWTPDEWLYKHPEIDENGDAIPATNRLPTRPPELAGNASQTQVTIFTNKVRIADYALAGSAAIKDAILKIHGPDIASETEAFDTGHSAVEVWTLYNHVLIAYGILGPDDIAHFRQELRTWEMDKPIPANLARLRRIFAELARLNMFTSEVDKVAALVESTIHVPSISGIVTSYMSLHPTLAMQTFASLAAYIVEQLPLATAQARANSAAAKTVADAYTIETLRADLAIARAEIAAAQRVLPIAPGKKKLPAPTAADKAKWTPGRLYCWAHGFVKHNGVDCTKLTAEKAPQWKKDAANPGPLQGEYGSRTLE